MKKTIIPTLLLFAAFSTANAQFLVTPKEGDAVKLDGNITFSQDSDNELWSIGDTYNSSLELSKIDNIALSPHDEITIGDFYYSDGSWSSTLDSSKTPIGIIFYLGDPSVSDEALKAAHPGCVHGLVVGLKQVKCEWQEDYSGFDDEAGGITVGEWIEENTDYVSIATRSESITSVFNKIMGYNNTMGIDKFNDSDYGFDYEVLVGSKLSSAVDGAVPEGTSGWYIPSIKEVSLLCSGNIEGNIGDLGYEDTPDNVMMGIVNSKLAEIENAQELGGVYWSSTEYSVSQVHAVQFANGLVMQVSKGGSYLLRPVLAF